MDVTANPVGAESLLGSSSAPAGVEGVEQPGTATLAAGAGNRRMLRPGLCALLWVLLVAAIVLAFARSRFVYGTPLAPDYSLPSSWDALPSTIPDGFASEADVVPAECGENKQATVNSQAICLACGFWVYPRQIACAHRPRSTAFTSTRRASSPLHGTSPSKIVRRIYYPGSGS